MRGGPLELQTSSPNDSKLFPSRFDFFFGAFLTLSPSLPLSSPSVMIRRLSLLELVLDFAFEDEKDMLGAACVGLAAPFEGCFLWSCFVDSPSGIGRGGSPLSITRTHERRQKTTKPNHETFPSFVLRLSLREMFPSF